MAIRTQPLILQSSKNITPAVKYFTFSRPDNLPIPFKAGQFITLHIEHEGKNHHRSYSIANFPDDNSNTIEIAVALVEGGLASRVLSEMKPGTSIPVSGPYGLFVLKNEPVKRLILVGTGTGVCPYRSMLPELKKRMLEEDLSVTLLLGVRTFTELLFAEDFLQLAASCPRFEFIACYSREFPMVPDAFERSGHVQKQFDFINLNPENDIVYLCGNPGMIDDGFSLLTEFGFDKKAIRREKYSFSH